MSTLDRATIRAALESLADRLEADAERAELLVVGGAAMVLAYGARESTKDVDAIALLACERSAWLRAVASVGQEFQLPGDWINDGAKGFLHGVELGEVLLDRRSSRVVSASAPQLLAMKLSAWRDDIDIADARILMASLSSDKQATWAALSPYLVPGRELTAHYAFEDLWESTHGHS